LIFSKSTSVRTFKLLSGPAFQRKRVPYDQLTAYPPGAKALVDAFVAARGTEAGHSLIVPNRELIMFLVEHINAIYEAIKGENSRCLIRHCALSW
jgi:hypothetical protein